MLPNIATDEAKPHARGVKVKLQKPADFKKAILAAVLCWKQAVNQYQDLPGMDVGICAAILAVDLEKLRSGCANTEARALETLELAQTILGQNDDFVSTVSSMSKRSRMSMDVKVCRVNATWKQKQDFRLKITMIEDGKSVPLFTTIAYAKFKDKAIEQFLGDLQSLPNYAPCRSDGEVEAPAFQSLRPLVHAQLQRMVIDLHPLGGKQSRAKAAREHLQMVPGFSEQQKASFREHGHCILDKILPAGLTTQLLEWHQMQMLKSRGRVHKVKGAKTIFWKGGPKQKTDRGLTFHDSDIEPQLTKLAQIIAGGIGRSHGDLLKTIHLLQFQYGQIPQDWHQDSPFPMLGAMVHLENSLSTEFLDYRGRDLTRLYGTKRRDFMNAIWDLAESPEAQAQDEGRKLPAGSVVVFNTSHIHRAPPPPKKAEPDRNMIFLYFESNIVDAESDAIFSHNRSLAFPDSRAKVRKQLTTSLHTMVQAVIVAKTAAEAAAAFSASANAAGVEVEAYARLLLSLG